MFTNTASSHRGCEEGDTSHVSRGQE